MGRGLGTTQKKVIKILGNEPCKSAYLPYIISEIYDHYEYTKSEYQTVYGAVKRLEKRGKVKTYKGHNKPLRLGWYYEEISFYKWNLIVELIEN